MIYLDHNATTPILPEVREAMLPYLCEKWGNPSSSYGFGAKLKGDVEVAREQVAELIGGAFPREVHFTSGGTESNNTAIHAAVFSKPDKKHIVTSQVEHSSVLSYVDYLEKYHGFRITRLPVDADGLLCLMDLESSLTEDTGLVSLMWANNETGVLFPVQEISDLCRNRGVLFHCDAVQATGKLEINVKGIHFDYLSITGHKIGAPKGIGALYTNRKSPFVPFVNGGHQERSRRGGTENLAAIVGLGVAADLARMSYVHHHQSVRPLRDSLETGILREISGTTRNGKPAMRLANTTNLHFPGIESEALLLLLDQAGICASSGSACLADSPDPSHVIAAMKPGQAAHQSVRFSLGSSNSLDEIEIVIAALRSIVPSLRL